jgi:hypothetical protein
MPAGRGLLGPIDAALRTSQQSPYIRTRHSVLHLATSASYSASSPHARPTAANS